MRVWNFCAPLKNILGNAGPNLVSQARAQVKLYICTFVILSRPFHVHLENLVCGNVNLRTVSLRHVDTTSHKCRYTVFTAVHSPFFLFTRMRKFSVFRVRRDAGDQKHPTSSPTSRHQLTFLCTASTIRDEIDYSVTILVSIILLW